jgi:hypothetical protein
MKMEQAECTETSAYKIQTPRNYPEENIQHAEHGESLKSRIMSPTLQETLGVIRNLKNNRVPGEDSITLELIKYGGRKLWNRIHQLITTIWKTEQMP